MDQRAKLMSEIMSLITYLSTISSFFLSFLSLYAPAFMVIFAALTCSMNYHFQRQRIKLLIKQKAEDDSI